MEFILVSFLAGVLTVLAPCVLSLLPVILGGSLGTKNPWRPLVIALSLGVSVVLFTLLLKASTVLIGVPDMFWRFISGGLVLLFGLTMLFPNAWSTLALKMNLYKSESLLQKGQNEGGFKGAMILGAALGPVFTTCSPTYSIILATVLPQNFWVGFLNLLAYALGLVLLLLLIGYGGQSVVRRFKWAANPTGWFKKMLGVLLVLTGLAVLTGFDKDIEAWILDQGYFGPIQLEESLRASFE